MVLSQLLDEALSEGQILGVGVGLGVVGVGSDGVGGEGGTTPSMLNFPFLWLVGALGVDLDLMPCLSPYSF